LAWNETIDVFVKSADFGLSESCLNLKNQMTSHSGDIQLVSIYKVGKHNVIIPAELMESRGTLKLLDFAIPFEACSWREAYSCWMNSTLQFILNWSKV